MAAIDGVNGMRMEDASERIGSFATQSVTVPVVDEKTKELQAQIQGKQIELQRLSANETMAEEEKMQKRQELLKQVSSLNTELRQHQLDKQREKKLETNAKSPSGNENSDSKKTDDASEDSNILPMSAQGMQAVIFADTAAKQAVSQGGVVSSLEGRSRVLESEIALDTGRGTSAEKKEMELENLSYAVESATISQLGMVGTANVQLSEAMTREQQEDKDERKKVHEVQKTITTPSLAKNELTAAERNQSSKNTTPKLYSSTGRVLSEGMGFSVSFKG